MMGYWFGYNMMGGWFGMMIMPIILILAFLYIINKHGESSNYKSSGSRDNALDILNERFARGEINEDEYISKKNILKQR